jgi:hypothetical protein
VIVVWAIVWEKTLAPLMPRPDWYIWALFAGAPGVIAFLLTFIPKANSQAVAALKAVVVASLIFAPFLGAYIIALPVLYTVVVFTLKMIENRKKEPEDQPFAANAKREKLSPAQWQLMILIVAFAVGAIVYRELMHERLGHTAAMFVGIPVLMAILLALTPKAKTVTGAIMKGITLALLIVAPLLGEGYLCILMASPLFYLVGIVVAAVVGFVKNENRKRKNARLSCLALILIPMSLEGVVPGLSFNRAQTVEVSRVVDAPADAVERRLAQSPEIAKALPRALRIGFPRPLNASGRGLDIGDLRTIHFAGAEGDPPGDLTMRVAARGPGYVRFQTESDSSKLTQWIAWDGSEVEWRPVDERHTSVTWRVHFERQLDPAWYFAPLERAAVHEAAKYLIEANATPYVNAPGKLSN